MHDKLSLSQWEGKLSKNEFGGVLNIDKIRVKSAPITELSAILESYQEELM